MGADMNVILKNKYECDYNLLIEDMTITFKITLQVVLKNVMSLEIK